MELWLISIRELKTDLAPNWPAIRTWIGREFGRESKTVLTVNSAVNQRQTWVHFNGHFRPRIRRQTWHPIGQQFVREFGRESKTVLTVNQRQTWVPFNGHFRPRTFSLVEIYFECFMCVSGLSAQIFRLEQNHGGLDEIPTKLVPTVLKKYTISVN